jgi:hypothetical protein
MKLVNCTPHSIRIITGQGDITIPGSGRVARVDAKAEIIGQIDTIPVFSTQYGEIRGLPEKQSGTVYVVSRVVATAAAERTDLLVPHSLIRLPSGAILGARGLARVS